MQDYKCQCDYSFKIDWGTWVDQWIQKAVNAKDIDGWFGKGKAPGHALDQVSCWVNNPRDMINLQNYIYWKRYDWSNQKAPQSNWNSEDPSSLRVYWGWNEVPVDRATVSDTTLRDAVIIKLPAALCSGAISVPGGVDTIACLSIGAQENLEHDLDKWKDKHLIKFGASHIKSRPGSAVVFVREYGNYFASNAGRDLNWQRYFYCENWMSPNKKYEIKFETKSEDSAGEGKCFVKENSGGNKVFV